MILPINIFTWLFLLIPPILVFAVWPSASTRYRVGRLVVAIVLGWATLNLAMRCVDSFYSYVFACYPAENFRWERYDFFSTAGKEIVESRHRANWYPEEIRVYNLTLLFLDGWIWSIFFVGMWESVRRLLRRITIILMKMFRVYGNAEYGIISCNYFSRNLIIIACISPLLVALLIYLELTKTSNYGFTYLVFQYQIGEDFYDAFFRD